MAKRERYNVLVILTNNTALMWKEARGIAPESAADKLDKAMLEWQSALNKTLKIWIDKGLMMTTQKRKACHHRRVLCTFSDIDKSNRTRLQHQIRSTFSTAPAFADCRRMQHNNEESSVGKALI